MIKNSRSCLKLSGVRGVVGCGANEKTATAEAQKKTETQKNPDSHTRSVNKSHSGCVMGSRNWSDWSNYSDFGFLSTNRISSTGWR